MKSLVSIVHTVVTAILTDAQLAYPPLVSEFGRDKAKLASLVANRGVGLLTLDLPALDGILTDALESGRLVLSGALTKRVSDRIRVPCLFRGLWLRVFHNDGTLRQEPDPTAVDFLRQLFCFAKKIELPCSTSRERDAVNEFCSIEREMRLPTLDWASDDPFASVSVAELTFRGMLDDVSRTRLHPALFEDDADGVCGEDTDLLERLDSICRDVSTRFGLFEPVDYEKSRLFGLDRRASGTKNGPGAVSDRTSKEEKYFFRNWPDKLQRDFPIDFFGQRPEEVGEVFFNLEHPSKLIMVPKTAKGPRLIASEPSYYQWTQQLVRAFLEERTPDVFNGKIISFRDQSKSHPLVAAGSLDRKTVTVDLSSASDRLSCWAIERAWASNLSILSAFHSCRTRVVGPSRRVDIDHAFLRKFSTMGSALTFPVQSIFYACVALASLPGRPRLDSQLARWGNQTRVYGDDIVVPVEGYAGLQRLLHLLGLKINKRKTFVDAPFRESCGFDAFMGYNVTPVKPRHLDPTTPVGRLSIIESSNNLFLKGYWRAAHALTSLLPEVTVKNLPVVRPESGACALISFSSTEVGHLKSRFNHNLQREEVLVTSYTSKNETTERVGTDYSHQSLHQLTFKTDASILAEPSRGLLGRVVKAVTRERRSWVASEVLTVCGMAAAPSRKGRALSAA